MLCKPGGDWVLAKPIKGSGGGNTFEIEVQLVASGNMVGKKRAKL